MNMLYTNNIQRSIFILFKAVLAKSEGNRNANSDSDNFLSTVSSILPAHYISSRLVGDLEVDPVGYDEVSFFFAPCTILVLGKIHSSTYKEYIKNTFIRWMFNIVTVMLILLLGVLSWNFLNTPQDDFLYPDIFIAAYVVQVLMATVFLILSFFRKFRINPEKNYKEIVNSIIQISYFMHAFLLVMAYEAVILCTYNTGKAVMRSNPIVMSSVFYYIGRSFDITDPSAPNQPDIFKNLRLITGISASIVLYILKRHLKTIKSFLLNN